MTQKGRKRTVHLDVRETKEHSCDIHTKKKDTWMCDIHTNIMEAYKIVVWQSHQKKVEKVSLRKAAKRCGSTRKTRRM